jgi:hypothetical protein
VKSPVNVFKAIFAYITLNGYMHVISLSIDILDPHMVSRNLCLKSRPWSSGSCCAMPCRAMVSRVRKCDITGAYQQHLYSSSYHKHMCFCLFEGNTRMQLLQEGFSIHHDCTEGQPLFVSG